MSNNIQLTFTGVCCVTKKEQTISFFADSAFSFETPKRYLKLLKEPCEIERKNHFVCKECSIYNKIPNEFNFDV